ncbi:MAG: adenine phosphoribosyltransferase [Epulopiscium sp.]|nr:adenine phosphoribosyltransferase [Candidatus Epulonipiscium sp.]
MDLKSMVRSVPDFPQKGVIFRDITPLLQDPEGLQNSIDALYERLKDEEFDYIIGPESRGFIFGVPLAYKMKKGFIPVRKAGKLPYKTKQKEYDLEYGTSIIEMHVDAIQPGQKVVIVDDLLATGGTSKVMVDLIEAMGGQVVKLVYLIELEFLNGREQLEKYKIESVIQY